MKNTLESKSEKHNHAVVVGYLISKKSDMDKIHVNEYYNEFLEIKKSSSIDIIKDKLKNKLWFSNLIKNFMSTRPYSESNIRKRRMVYYEEEDYRDLKESLDEKSKKDPPLLQNWKRYKQTEKPVLYRYSYPILGEYDRNSKKIILYTNNIKDCCSWVEVERVERFDKEKAMKYARSVLVHELFHSYFHFVTEQNIHRQNIENYIFEIEEAMAEFCTLVFLRKQGEVWTDFYKFAFEDIKNKQDYVGVLAAYGFGAFLYKELKNDKQRFELINSYIKKLGNINEEDDKVKEYKREVRLSKWGDQQKCLKLLQEILKP